MDPSGCQAEANVVGLGHTGPWGPGKAVSVTVSKIRFARAVPGVPAVPGDPVLGGMGACPFYAGFLTHSGHQ